MSEPRDPRIAELVHRVVEQAPPAPAFPELVAAPRPPRRRVLVAAVAIAVVVALVVALVRVNDSGRSKGSIVVANPTTTVPAAPPVAIERPSALAVGPDGTLYVGDVGTHQVVAVASDGATRVVTHGDAGGLAFDDRGVLFVADDATNTVRSVAPDGGETTIAGDGTAGFSGDGGPAIRAKLGDPSALAFGPDRALYIADSSNERIRRVAPDGMITTFAGNGTPGYTGDGGRAVDAGLDPQAIAFDGNGNLVVFQFDVKTVRRIAPDGIISTVKESVYASAFAATPDGDVDVADYGEFGISRISRDGSVSVVPFRHSGLFRPIAIAVAPNGDVYVADDGGSSGGPMRVLVVHPDGSSADALPQAATGPSPSTMTVPLARVGRLASKIDAAGGGLLNPPEETDVPVISAEAALDPKDGSGNPLHVRDMYPGVDPVLRLARYTGFSLPEPYVRLVWLVVFNHVEVPNTGPAGPSGTTSTTFRAGPPAGSWIVVVDATTGTALAEIGEGALSADELG